MDQRQGKRCMASLPPEVMVEVAMHLGPREWLRLAHVNRAFRALFSHQPLWRRLHHSRFPPATDPTSGTTLLGGGGGSDGLKAIKLLPRYVVSGALDGRLKVWERGTGECRYTFAKHKAAITCLRYDLRTRAMVSGSLDRTLHFSLNNGIPHVSRLYNLESGTTNALPHAGQVLTLQLRDDTLYTGGSHGLVFVYSVTEAAASMKAPAVSILSGHDGAITALATDEPGHLLASGGADAVVKLCDPRVPRSVLPAKLTGHSAAITAVSVRDTVAVTSSRAPKGELLVWDLRKVGERHDGQPAALLRNLASANAVRSSCYDGTKLLASTDGDNCVRVWDPRDWTCGAKWPHAAPLLCLDSPSTKAFVAGGQDYSVSLWEKQPKAPTNGSAQKTGQRGEERKVNINDGM
ncbi:Fbox domain containing protein [Acanthamoeba castellanii str. Neff]|uniref:Fbox domain containing protein n=1 Tax=Acanthamoeba castellanii (strain ATCC 30010 / Neff) TaxID=1257118 RepID=L8GI37_ACACF|nr:Fbox domain containing protein [Acanthamoeba castellanii str. Neff]ELR12612.1 Fbox domain containing protein [Acanthamoeba castellanii str. Neff]